MRTALVYDRVNKWGGAERVLLTLHEMFPDAPLFTSVYDPKSAGWARVFPEVVPSFLQKLSFFRTRHEKLAFLMPLAFESFDFYGYDVVISVTSEAAKGIITKPITKHVCYCLTPTRYLWSGYGEYFDSSFKRSMSKPIISYLRKWDKIAGQRPDVMVAISSEVKGRIKKYYGREAAIVYPPVDLSLKNSLLRGPRLRGSAIRSFFKDSNPNNYLLVGRLVKYKRVDLVIEAFNELELSLIIVGEGGEERKLRRMARKNIRFVKDLTDEELANYYNNCRALVAPQREDFGLVMVEAMVMGKPVIALREGGALEIVEDGKTGVFFDKQSKESIIETIRRFEKMTFNEEVIRTSAERFSKERFMREFLEVIKE